jgi:thiol:disulfide interchange protein
MTILKLALFAASLPLAFGQKLDPIQWAITSDAKAAPAGSKVLLQLTARIDSGWHLYSLTTPKGGANPTTIKMEGGQVFQPAPVRKFDPNFQIDTETFEGTVVFLIEAVLPAGASGEAELTANMRYQACTEKECLPPRKKSAATKVTLSASAAAPVVVIPAGYTLFDPAATERVAPAVKPADQGLGGFLLLAFGLGIAAIFTPCVFPMIPLVMSQFLNGGANALRQAIVFCLGIVVLFSSIGLGITAALGPFGIVQLGANPWVNAFIAIVFLAFGLSLLGAFELTIPSGLLTRLNQASDRGGYIGSLLMGLTFALTSFACVGPFMGTLLAASVQGDKMQPVLGMIAFSSGLASPFFLLALFPAYLQKLPRSGGWLSRVKVVLGFIVLAMAMKYLSNVDQVFQLGILTRERILASWFVFLCLPGIYLLGFLRLEGVKSDETVGIGRLFSAAVLLILAVSILPGMIGLHLGELEAHLPAATSTFGGGAKSELNFQKNNYKEALIQAKAENKRVFLDFTGYTCTNCKWMKTNMFPKPAVTAELKNFILVELYTDGTDAASIENQQLQEKRFGTVAIPFYAIVDADEHVVATSAGLTKNTDEFLKFLKQGGA